MKSAVVSRIEQMLEGVQRYGACYMNFATPLQAEGFRSSFYHWRKRESHKEWTETYLIASTIIVFREGSTLRFESVAERPAKNMPQDTKADNA